MAKLAARQHGVVARRQLRALGVTDSFLARSIAANRLHPVFRGVFAVGHPAIGEAARMRAATLACDEKTVVSHQTAAALLGLRDRTPAVIDVIAGAESGRSIDGIRCHRVPLPRSDELGHCNAIPCTSPARTIVDLAGVLGERSLRRVVERAATLEVFDPAAIERVLEGRRRRGAPILRGILSEWGVASEGKRQATGRSEPNAPAKLRSDLEARLLALIGSVDLPAPICNQRVEADGREVEVDFLWRDQRLVVETDGKAFHDNPLAFERDRKRDRDLQLNGYRVVRFTHRQIEREPDVVIVAIRRLLSTDFG